MEEGVCWRQRLSHIKYWLKFAMLYRATSKIPLKLNDTNYNMLQIGMRFAHSLSVSHSVSITLGLNAYVERSSSIEHKRQKHNSMKSYMPNISWMTRKVSNFKTIKKHTQRSSSSSGSSGERERERALHVHDKNGNHMSERHESSLAFSWIHCLSDSLMAFHWLWKFKIALLTYVYSNLANNVFEITWNDYFWIELL